MSKMQNNNSIADSKLDNVIGKPQLGRLEQLLSMFPVIGSKTSKTVIAVLRLSGVIGKVSSVKSGLTIESLNELIEKAFNIKNIKALCLIINSPGGSPVQSELIAKRIRSLASEKKIPVYSFIEDVAASGGYWLACIGDQIYASRSSIIGSIGVITSGFGFSAAINKLGIERRIYAAGQNKSILDPFQPVQEEDIKIIKKLQEQVHLHFIDYVKERRTGKLTQDDNILFNGEFWSGETATDFGLIDGIDDMYNFIQQKYGDVNIKYISPKQSWFKKKLGISKQEIVQQFSDRLIESIDNKIAYNKFDIY